MQQEPTWDTKQHRLHSANCLGFRAIERVSEYHSHLLGETVRNKAGRCPAVSKIPQVGEQG